MHAHAPAATHHPARRPSLPPARTRSYARTGKAARADFAAFTRAYLSQRPSLVMVLLLVDASIPPQELDLEYAAWLAGARAAGRAQPSRRCVRHVRPRARIACLHGLAAPACAARGLPHGGHSHLCARACCCCCLHRALPSGAGVPFSLVFTKADKRKKGGPRAGDNVAAFKRSLIQAHGFGAVPPSLITSASSGLGKQEVLGFVASLRVLYEQTAGQQGGGGKAAPKGETAG